MLPARLQFLITMIACAINERMQRKLDHTQEEVRVLKEILAAITDSGRIPFTADQRCRLAVVGRALSPEERKKCCQIVKPGTLLGWFRQMAAQKCDSSKKKVGRPRKKKNIRKLVVAMALASLGWGYTKIRNALRTGLKSEFGRTTVANILLEEGSEPAPEREKKRTWKEFMKSHWDTLYACDFFSVEALGPFDTVRYMVFFVIEFKSRAVEIAGIAVDPGEAWMNQVARNLTDPVDGFLLRNIGAVPYANKNPATSAAAVRVSRATDQKVRLSQLSGRSAWPLRFHQIRQMATGASKPAASATGKGNPAAARMGNDANAMATAVTYQRTERAPPRRTTRVRLPAAASPTLSGTPTASSIANCRQQGGMMAKSRMRKPTRSGTCKVNAKNGTSAVTTRTTSNSPSQVECNRRGGPLYSHDRTRIVSAVGTSTGPG